MSECGIVRCPQPQTTKRVCKRQRVEHQRIQTLSPELSVFLVIKVWRYMCTSCKSRAWKTPGSIPSRADVGSNPLQAATAAVCWIGEPALRPGVTTSRTAAKRSGECRPGRVLPDHWRGPQPVRRLGARARERQKEFPWIILSRCVAHVIDLCLKDVGCLPTVHGIGSAWNRKCCTS